MVILSEINQNLQELKQHLKEQNRFLQDIESAQRKLKLRKREAIEQIASLTGAVQAYEQCLMLLKKEETQQKDSDKESERMHV